MARKAVSRLLRIGAVSRDDGSLTTLVADATAAASWGGAQLPSGGLAGEPGDFSGTDFARACEVFDASGHASELGGEMEWTDGQGVVTELGGAGSAEVFRLAADELLLAPLFPTSDWSEQTEAMFRADIGALPAKSTSVVGRVSIASGVVALIWAGARATGITEARLSTARSKGASNRSWGVLSALPNGTYDVVYERLDVSTSWGVLDCRLRIVPTGRAPAVLERGEATSRPAKATGRVDPPPRHVLELAQATNRVASIVFSPDGATLALGGGGVCSAALFHVPAFTRLASFDDIAPPTRLLFGATDVQTARYLLGVLVCFDPTGETDHSSEV